MKEVELAIKSYECESGGDSEAMDLGVQDDFNLEEAVQYINKELSDWDKKLNWSSFTRVSDGHIVVYSHPKGEWTLQTDIEFSPEDYNFVKNILVKIGVHN